jgi:hypothetical protein
VFGDYCGTLYATDQSLVAYVTDYMVGLVGLEPTTKGL